MSEEELIRCAMDSTRVGDGIRQLDLLADRIRRLQNERERLANGLRGIASECLRPTDPRARELAVTIENMVIATLRREQMWPVTPEVSDA